MVLPTPTPQEIEEFKKIYQANFGVELTDQEAFDVSTRVLRLYCLAKYGEVKYDKRAN